MGSYDAGSRDGLFWNWPEWSFENLPQSLSLGNRCVMLVVFTSFELFYGGYWCRYQSKFLLVKVAIVIRYNSFIFFQMKLENHITFCFHSTSLDKQNIRSRNIFRHFLDDGTRKAIETFLQGKFSSVICWFEDSDAHIPTTVWDINSGDINLEHKLVTQMTDIPPTTNRMKEFRNSVLFDRVFISFPFFMKLFFLKKSICTLKQIPMKRFLWRYMIVRMAGGLTQISQKLTLTQLRDIC